jgi:hypothetical protein
MPWYYVGPDAKPVGPISLEELQSRRASGALSPETYVIEAPVQGATKDWRHYREVFPHGDTLPSLPAIPPVPTSLPPPARPHPLFPSAVPASSLQSPGGPVFTGVHPSTYNPPHHAPSRVNSWCAWGFGLGLAGLPSLVCGVGLFLAMAGLAVSIIGLVQVHKDRSQQGRGLAIGGIAASLVTLAIALAIGIAMMYSSLHGGVKMTTEQTSNDTDSR